jgi:hypothetical protein
MSTNFERKIFMPAGVQGAIILPCEHRQRVARWYSDEWNQFVEELQAYKRKLAVAAYDAIQWNKEHCIVCRQFNGPRWQRGSIQMSANAAAAAVTVMDCTFTASTIPNLSCFRISPTDARTLARLHTDGDWYSTTCSTGFGASDGTWQGGCAVSGYDSRWNQISGDAPAYQVSGTDGAWSDASVTGAAIGYEVTGIGLLTGSFSVEIRDGASLNVLFTDAFTMSADVDPKN